MPDKLHCKLTVYVMQDGLYLWVQADCVRDVQQTALVGAEQTKHVGVSPRPGVTQLHRVTRLKESEVIHFLGVLLLKTSSA